MADKIERMRNKVKGDRTHLVSNKMVIFDCLIQCREDYMASAEDAIKRHREYRADTELKPGERQMALDMTAAIITRAEKRLAMIRKAMDELT